MSMVPSRSVVNPRLDRRARTRNVRTNIRKRYRLGPFWQGPNLLQRKSILFIIEPYLEVSALCVAIITDEEYVWNAIRREWK
jgi:hypothetical protein